MARSILAVLLGWLTFCIPSGLLLQLMLAKRGTAVPRLLALPY